MAKASLAVKVEPEDLERLDRIAREMSLRAGGVEVNRSDAARAVLGAGLDAMEARLSLTAAAQKGGKPARKPK